ncbi:MAG: hypothetical protein NC483_00425 [Ruminococcus sp.]|nr:hypothetical protein [Ruminococcus sp.]
MKKLSKRQIKKFAKKYMPDWESDVKEVMLFKDKNKRIYLVNKHYFIIDDNKTILEKDLQEYL